jgi:hypothetical protein
LTPEISSDVTSPYQNPGPPIPRRGPREERSEDSPPATVDREPTLLEGWIQARSQHSPHTYASLLDASQEEEPASSRSENVQAISVRQSMAAGSSQAKSSSSKSNAQRKLVSPFKRPRLSHFPPSPEEDDPSQTHTKDSEGPFLGLHSGESVRKQRSHQELDDILEFERQKKAVTQQRRSALRAARGRQVDVNLYSVNNSHARSEQRYREKYSSRFGDQQGTERSHEWVESTTGNDGENHTSDAVDDGCRRLTNVKDVPQNEMSSIPDGDPRAHLIRRQKMQEEESHASAAGLMRTGLKIRRVKSTRLPFETIPQGDELYHLAFPFEYGAKKEAVVDTGVSTGLGLVTEHLALLDEYVKRGAIDRMKWNSNSRDVALWEADMLSMLRTEHSDARTVVADRGFHIAKAIKAHVDEYGE